MTDVTPIPSVGVVVFSKEFVLLVRHKKGADNVTGIYGLPSGRLEDGETNISAAKRELAEETGLITTEEHLTQLPESYTGELDSTCVQWYRV
jgi:8-oxo-dGTP pyrophosphatase MutT (NUDIX family)